MPISKYYSGHGEKVMSEMKKHYGSEKGERVFYATANKKDQKSEDKHSRKRKGAVKGLKKAGNSHKYSA